MASFKNVKYIRSSVNFTSISSVSDIRNKGKVTVKWNLVLKNKEDIEELYLTRAVLNNKEKANLGSQEVLKKFRKIYSWKRGVNSGEPVKEFTDVFKWDDNSSNNLHNLNVSNEANWDEAKFKAVLREIAAGERGLIYKIYGYSRRMNRAATPIGFFCDAGNIVALSQRNQVINDRWYSECGQVWKAGSSVVGSNEFFVRVAVDMNRDLGEKPKKCRRVWATTNKGRIVLFDYWTGTIIWHKIVSKDVPLYAMAFDAYHNMLVYYDGFSNIVSLKEDVDSNTVITVKSAGPFGNFQPGADFAKREMGAVCTNERDNTGKVTGVYFYLITNRETVVKFKITKNNIKKSQTIPRTHFGCTAKWGDIKQNKNQSVLGETPANQNNIYGIGAGVNGHVWVNGHTPITVLSYDIKDSGNPIKVKVRLGRGNKKWVLGSDGKAKAVQDWTNGTLGCASIWDHADTKDWWYKLAHPPAGDLNGPIASGKNAEWYVTSNNVTGYNFGKKRDSKESDSESVITSTWDYSARMFGETRPNKSHPNASIGCKLGIHKTKGIAWINSLLDTYDYHGNKIDKRVLGAGTKITAASLEWLDIPMEKSTNSNENWVFPENDPDVINRIHLELVSVEDGDDFDYVDKSFLQDLNFVYGCASNENYNDSCGRIEELEHPQSTNTSEANYRREISAASNRDKSNLWIDSTTKWLTGGNSSTVYENQYGFAGRPFAYNEKNHTYDDSSDKIKTLDKMVGKPHTFDARNAASERWRFNNVYNVEYTDEGGSKHYYIDISKYNEHLPMSMASIYPRLPSDGRMFISKSDANAYKAAGESNALVYEIFFADRREGKIGYLNYNRPSGETADTSYPVSYSGRRVGYTDNTASLVKKKDGDREYYCATGSTKEAFLDDAPYHVVIDSDNNPWFTSQKYIGKMQLLNNDNGRKDKYVYNSTAGSGLFAFENNNKMFESSLFLLEKHAKNGAYYSSSLIPNGIKNGDNGYSSGIYSSAQKMLDDGKFTLSANNSANKAYVYNYEPWKKTAGGPWDINNVFSSDGGAVWKIAYTKNSAKYTSHTNNVAYNGNHQNEYNSDNFGLNCLIQMNKVELGPDYIHPKILKPTAKSKIIKAVSRSNSDRCDTHDGSAFWNKHTAIFNSARTASGYDDLDTTHYIYDIDSNYRHLIYHRYEYHDQTVVGSNTNGYISRRHTFEFDDSGNLINLANVIDNNSSVVWHTPNYVALVPPYGSLATLSASDAHAKNNQYWVDLYVDYTPTVYNYWLRDDAGQYETIQVGHHDVHVFERWPTPDYCVRGIGNSESTDKITEYDLVGTYYWGECVNDSKCSN